MKLYELTQQFKEVQDLDPEIIGDTLDAISLEINEKAKNIGFVYKNLNSDIAVIDEEIKRLQAMKATRKNKVEALKDYLRINMTECGIKKIECDLFKINCVSGRDVVEVMSERDIPEKYFKVVRSLDKALLLSDLKCEKVSGAQLAKTKDSIRIS
jgi:uncharacterized small protein (DUF1192 family)